MSDAENRVDLSQRRLKTLVEAGAAVILSAAALLTSWAGFQAALWDGEQAAAYARAGVARVEAGALSTKNGQLEGVDLLLFTQWLDALARHDHRLQTFYRARFRPEFRAAFDDWIRLEPHGNPTVPQTPFAMREYAPQLAQQAAAMNKRADDLFARGQRANDVSDAFVQATVILAIALFLGGIGQTFDHERVRIGLGAMAALACLFGLAQLIALPVLSLH